MSVPMRGTSSSSSSSSSSSGGDLPCLACQPAHLRTATPRLLPAGLPAVPACREEGGLFRFCLPLQDLVGVDMQPEIFIRCVWGVCGVCVTGSGHLCIY